MVPNKSISERPIKTANTTLVAAYQKRLRAMTPLPSPNSTILHGP
jgi:hypothetical protein